MINRQLAAGILLLSGLANLQAQNAPNALQVISWSTLSDRSTQTVGPFVPGATGTFNRAAFAVYTATTPPADLNAFLASINNIGNYQGSFDPPTSNVTAALNTSIAVALSTIPISSPSSALILRTDPATGVPLPSSATLGPIATQRAETVGKGNIYLGFNHNNYHFTEYNGQSLNGLTVLYPGGDPSPGLTGIIPGAATAPATMNMGLDIRIAQNIAFLTMGVTNRFDISAGFPLVHASVASRAYNGIVYSGTGTDFSPGNQCWCQNTLTPGTFDLVSPEIGLASAGKTGFGDLLLRFKGKVLDRRNAALALGADLRLPTGDEENYLGLGTTSVRPFAALSLYPNPGGRIIFAPHFELGWQVSGKSVLGGQLSPTSGLATLSNGNRVPYLTTPFTATKDTLPDVFNWAAGTEIALGSRNTVIVDVIGNQIGLINGAPKIAMQTRDTRPNAPSHPAITPQSAGFVDAGKGSFGQYSGAFGYKARITGDLVFHVQALVRFDSNALTARFVPSYGLGYSFR